MASAKKQSEQHIIDREGEKLLRAKLPQHWLLRDYRPDYGLDFTIETFKTGIAADGKLKTYETLGEHVFVQLKSVADPTPAPLTLYGRGNVEKAPEQLDRQDKVADVDTYRFQLETSELVTVERMGIGVPVLLVIADLARERCSFVCLNDYIDKILIPRHADYRDKGSRTIHVPVRNEIGSNMGQVALRWYAKRPKLLAAFQRFTYQFSELQWAEHGDWRGLANYFARRIAAYDFWDDTEMCVPISYDAGGLRRFMETGQPGFFKRPAETPKGFDAAEMTAHFEKADLQHDAMDRFERLFAGAELEGEMEVADRDGEPVAEILDSAVWRVPQSIRRRSAGRGDHGAVLRDEAKPVGQVAKLGPDGCRNSALVGQ